MMRLSLIESFAAVVAVQALAAVAVLSLRRFDAWLRRALPFVISIAIGVLLATGAVHLLPEAVEALGNRTAVWMDVVVTMLALYAFERCFQVLSGVSAEPAQLHNGTHGHHDHHHASKPATLLVGCLTHSLVDGTSVAAAFSVDERVGWITALAVGLHEIPHRLGDFALLIHMGLRPARAALLAIGAGMSALLGWAFVLLLGSHGAQRVAWLLPVSAGSFLYISLVDLLPELQAERRAGRVAWQIACLALGMALAVGLTRMKGA